MKALYKYDSYNQYKVNKPSIKKYIAYCSTGENIYEEDYSKYYLTFIAAQDNVQFSLSSNIENETTTLQYSLNNGLTWVSINSDELTPVINFGQQISFKANIVPTESGVGTFSSTGYFNIKGNPMSLLLGDNYYEVYDISSYPNAFRNLFRENKFCKNAQHMSLCATTLSEYCYGHMFYNCSALETPPLKLPALSISVNAYRSMFNQCSSMIISPEIAATQCNNYGCYSMFQASKITDTPELLFTTIGDYALAYMFYRCKSLINSCELLFTTIGNYGCYRMFRECNNLVYTTSKLLPLNVPQHGYYQMYYQNSQLITMPEIMATEIGQYGCFGMFEQCTSLVNQNDIHITNVGYYGCVYMFKNCTSLIICPEFAPTTLGEYACQEMFSNCESMTTPMRELPAEIVPKNAYYSMFNGYNSLTYAPEIKAKTVGEYGCYCMFYYSDKMTSIQKTLYIESVDKGGCYGMFDHTAITTLPELQITTVGVQALMLMFEACNSLVNIELTLPATTLSDGCYAYMFRNCKSLVTANIVLPALECKTDCYRNMFLGCDKLVQGPEILPATTLAARCYIYMFSGCSSLLRAPILPALTLATECYREMLVRCTNLNYIKMLATDVSASNAVLDWVTNSGVNGGTFVQNDEATWTSPGYNGWRFAAHWDLIKESEEQAA